MQELKIENENLRKRVLELERYEIARSNKSCKKIKTRSFDFSKYKKRHIALTICYLGWSYDGLAAQQTTENTVIENVYKALEKCRLIENREESNVAVCGRTDKGVSAFRQVISFYARSNVSFGTGIVPESGINISQRKDSCDTEIDYVFLLNKVLPVDIRALKWAPVEFDFSARFSCRNRMYKYYFPKSNLSIEKMIEAGQKLLGEHDFRNFCCMQIRNGVTQYVRSILSFNIESFDKNEKDDMYNVYVLTIKGSAFIYHQIRCIVAIIFMIGQHLENLDIIDKLLDIENDGGNGKPQYHMASDLPLVFHEATYDDIDWQVSQEALDDYVGTLDRLWTEFKVKETILKSFMNEIESSNLQINERAPLVAALSLEIKAKSHISLLDRLKEPTLEERIESENIKRANRVKK